MKKQNLVFLVAILFVFFPSVVVMSSTGVAGSGDEAAAVHIVYMEQPPPELEDHEMYHIQALSAVLGSEEAARDAILYHYRNVGSGFSAKLTPQQVEELAKHPRVLQVVPDRKLELH